MLPLYGLAVVSGQEGNGAGFVALTIVVAQAVIDRRINRSDANGGEGRLLAGPAHIVYRAARSRVDRGIGDQILGVFPVQALDGIGAGLQSVAVPGLVARILNGTGRVNVGQGP